MNSDGKGMLHVALLQSTPEPETTMALAARLCYSGASIEDLRRKLEKSDIAAFLTKIMSLGHHSVLEHASFTFGVEGISRACSHQLVRHRLASFSQQSQRYVTFTETELPVIIPETISGRPDMLVRFNEALTACAAAYGDLVAGGVPAEDARFIIPNAAETKLIVTMNARELLHFFAVRCCERAQWEIRAMAVEMLKLVKPLAPTVFASAGPGCIAGPCTEGQFCCGKTAAVREHFASL